VSVEEIFGVALVEFLWDHIIVVGSHRIIT